MIDRVKELAVKANIAIIDENGHLLNTCQEFGRVDRPLTVDRDYEDAAKTLMEHFEINK